MCDWGENDWRSETESVDSGILFALCQAVSFLRRTCPQELRRLHEKNFLSFSPLCDFLNTYCTLLGVGEAHRVTELVQRLEVHHRWCVALVKGAWFDFQSEFVRFQSVDALHLFRPELHGRLHFHRLSQEQKPTVLALYPTPSHKDADAIMRVGSLPFMVSGYRFLGVLGREDRGACVWLAPKEIGGPVWKFGIPAKGFAPTDHEILEGTQGGCVLRHPSLHSFTVIRVFFIWTS